ncbi:MAG: cupredoxin domain-containing protein [Ectothiorhodospiraceae bacterium]|nr:cupredoxin domain-containing protein [Ectothiorhodospiraceae bacterium]
MIRHCLFGAALAAAVTAAAAGDVVTVEMRDYGFHPAELEIKAGTTVRWVNMERRANHDVYFPELDLGSPRLFPEESWEHRFDEPGSHAYYCRPHEDRDMRGVILVVDDQEAP